MSCEGRDDDPHSRGCRDSEARPFCCGNKSSSRDPHKVCSSCLGPEHARLDIDVPGSCRHCAVLTLKSLCTQPLSPLRRPWCRKEGKGAAPATSASSGSQTDLAADAPPVEYGLELDMGEDEYATSDILISEDEEEHNVFIALSRAVQPRAPASFWDDDEESTPASPSPSSDMLVCKHTAVWLGILWPVIVVETTRSHYEGKKLPLGRSATKQLLPIFSELLADIACSWRDRLLSSRSPISGAFSLDCKSKESLDLFRMPPVDSLVAGHLQPQPTVLSRSLSLPSGKICAVQIVSSVAWTDGICHPCSPSWLPPHERIPAVGGLMWAESHASWFTASDGHTGVRQGTASLVGPVLPEPRGPDGLSPVQEGDHHRCQSLGLEWQSLRGCWSGRWWCGLT